VRRVWPAVLPWAAALAAFLLVAWTLFERAAALEVPAYDTAFFEQVVWNLGHGRGFQSGYFSANFLGLHFEPLLVVPALLERIWPDTRLLSLLEAAGIALTAPAGYLFLRRLLGDRRGAQIASVALAAPLPLWLALQDAAGAGFHPESMALPLLLLAGWAGLRGRMAWCWILVAIAICAKEDQAYAVLVLGLLLVRRGSHPRHGAVMAGLAVAWAGVLELWLMPMLRGSVRSDIASYYAWLHHPTPALLLQHLAAPAGWVGFAAIVASMAGLPLLRPGWLALAAPPLLGSLLSDHSPQPALHLQYGLPLVMPVFVAGGLGLERLLDTERFRFLRSQPALAALCVPALLIGGLWGPMVRGHPALAPSLLGQLDSCSAAIPASAPVATDDDVAAPLAARPWEVPLTWAGPSDWIVVDTEAKPPQYVDAQARTALLAHLAAGGRRLVCRQGRFEVWTPAQSGGRT
jgi:uncharacterized membrane protein